MYLWIQTIGNTLVPIYNNSYLWYNLDMNLVQHLKSRHLDLDLHRPVVDDTEGVATFYLYNLSGQLVGYQQYRPLGEKKPNNNPKEGKYFAYRKLPTLGVWGVESLHLTPDAEVRVSR